MSENAVVIGVSVEFGFCESDGQGICPSCGDVAERGRGAYLRLVGQAEPSCDKCRDAYWQLASSASMKRGTKAYEVNVAHGHFGMFSVEGDAAVARAVQLARAAMNQPGVDVRDVLRVEMERIDKQHPEAFDSEVWIHLTVAFEDIIPNDVAWARGWLEHKDEMKWIDVPVAGIGRALHTLENATDEKDIREVWDELWFIYGRLLEARGKVTVDVDSANCSDDFRTQARAFASREYVERRD